MLYSVRCRTSALCPMRECASRTLTQSLSQEPQEIRERARRDPRFSKRAPWGSCGVSFRYPSEHRYGSADTLGYAQHWLWSAAYSKIHRSTVCYPARFGCHSSFTPHRDTQSPDRRRDSPANTHTYATRTGFESPVVVLG